MDFSKWRLTPLTKATSFISTKYIRSFTQNLMIGLDALLRMAVLSSQLPKLNTMLLSISMMASLVLSGELTTTGLKAIPA